MKTCQYVKPKDIIKQIAPPFLIELLRKIKSIYCNTRGNPFDESDAPLFDGHDASFKKLVSTCKVYGEYGCGQSTQWVYLNSHAHIYSVDSSLEWAESIINMFPRAREDNESVTGRLHIHWVDMGKTGNWGRPVSYEKRRNFSDYTDWIWHQNVKPDLVLIDGHFRVACFFTSILYSSPGTQIIFDDYMDRPEYHLVEEFIPKAQMSGRQALFIVPLLNKEERHSIENILEKFRYVMD